MPEENIKPDKGQNPKRKKNFQSLSKPIPVRYPHEERKKIFEEAGKLELSASEYLRRKAENGTITIRHIDSKYEKLIYELNMVGNNLRQAVKLFYTHSDPYSAGENLTELSLEVARILKEIRKKLNY